MQMRRALHGGVLGALGAALLTLALLGCGGDKKKTTTGNDDDGDGTGPLVTAEMAGVWSYQMEMRDCTTNALIGNDAFQDTLCVGDDMGDVSGGDDSCNSQAQGSGYHVTCSSTDSFEGCTITSNLDFQVVFSNSAGTIDGTYNMTDSPAGCAGGGGCFKIHMTATKTGPVPSGACGVPNRGAADEVARMALRR